MSETTGDIGTVQGDIIIEVTAKGMTCLQYAGLVAVTPEQALTAAEYGWKQVDPKDYNVNPPIQENQVVITRSYKDREIYISARSYGNS